MLETSSRYPGDSHVMTPFLAANYRGNMRRAGGRHVKNVVGGSYALLNRKLESQTREGRVGEWQVRLGNNEAKWDKWIEKKEGRGDGRKGKLLLHPFLVENDRI